MNITSTICLLAVAASASSLRGHRQLTDRTYKSSSTIGIRGISVAQADLNGLYTRVEEGGKATQNDGKPVYLQGGDIYGNPAFLYSDGNPVYQLQGGDIYGNPAFLYSDGNPVYPLQGGDIYGNPAFLSCSTIGIRGISVAQTDLNGVYTRVEEGDMATQSDGKPVYQLQGGGIYGNPAFLYSVNNQWRVSEKVGPDVDWLYVNGGLWDGDAWQVFGDDNWQADSGVTVTCDGKVIAPAPTLCVYCLYNKDWSELPNDSQAAAKLLGYGYAKST